MSFNDPKEEGTLLLEKKKNCQGHLFWPRVGQKEEMDRQEELDVSIFIYIPLWTNLEGKCHTAIQTGVRMIMETLKLVSTFLGT